MAEEKKFLDAAGLKHFWEMCRLQNNEDFQTNLEIFEAMAAVLATKMQSPDGKGGVSEYFTAEEKELLNKIVAIGTDGKITTIDSNNNTVNTATESYVQEAIKDIPVASDSVLGLVKASEEVTVDKDGSLGVGEISSSKVTGLDDALASKAAAKDLKALEEKVGNEGDATTATLFGLVENNYNNSVVSMSYNESTNTVTYVTGDGKTHSFTVQDKDTTYTLGTDTTTGLTKLYAVTGSAEDGTLTQKAITNELNKKVGVKIDANSDTLVFVI